MFLHSPLLVKHFHRLKGKHMYAKYCKHSLTNSLTSRKFPRKILSAYLCLSLRKFHIANRCVAITEFGVYDINLRSLLTLYFTLIGRFRRRQKRWNVEKVSHAFWINWFFYNFRPAGSWKRIFWGKFVLKTLWTISEYQSSKMWKHYFANLISHDNLVNFLATWGIRNRTS